MLHLPASAVRLTTLASLVVLAVFPACDGPKLVGSTPPPPAVNLNCPAATSSPSMPRALIGPDVDVRVFCAQSTSAAIASIEELGPGLTQWSFTVTGDPAFQPGQVQSANTMPRGQSPDASTPGGPFTACQSNSPEIAFVTFTPPQTATPGATFDAIATVHAEDGSFPDGTVKLHGEVGAPVVTLDPLDSPFAMGNETSVDVGPLVQGFGRLTFDLTFRPQNGAAVNVRADSDGSPFFSILPAQNSSSSVQIWTVTFLEDYPGDYAAKVVWTGSPGNSLTLTTACDWTTTMMLHARVVADGGSDANTANVSDGGADRAPDAP
jgi:hypothetical protein